MPETALTPRPGMTIANGATVLQARALPHARLNWVFLCLWNTEFVTWVGAIDGSETCWGHYHGDDIRAALDDYTDRT